MRQSTFDGTKDSEASGFATGIAHSGPSAPRLIGGTIIPGILVKADNGEQLALAPCHTTRDFPLTLNAPYPLGARGSQRNGASQLAGKASLS